MLVGLRLAEHQALAVDLGDRLSNEYSSALEVEAPDAESAHLASAQARVRGESNQRREASVDGAGERFHLLSAQKHHLRLRGGRHANSVARIRPDRASSFRRREREAQYLARATHRPGRRTLRKHVGNESADIGLLDGSDRNAFEHREHVHAHGAFVTDACPWTNVRRRREPFVGPLLERRARQARVDVVAPRHVRLHGRQPSIGLRARAVVFDAFASGRIAVRGLPASIRKFSNRH